ncbi:Peptidoglycan/LPS O-acetylase OafA/YrhL, contains acyltransferase and SGNH-hydrolase domains [Geodermatophilus amargosae]|uniref:Peptidoglycan/LPS O-acetylase OafA/YrhL, contains acyltransferase and SGNH-hydrolase domains n=1 Tax=Geodermatophilus amargosae TaxID=1296565 RepID=A0A1I6X6D5_9ACTN|nr:acyltransferase [Geodermatophilus amargosae]SFT33809.1 Peptidoglycan/LPS O-acetylase OafA/YrhL, contains acyltransferase and SGNH-hydrolase domains [Geodermatophilus amargosae]
MAFFFVLSGFVLAWGTRPDLPARTFWRRRFARVYPSDFVMLAVAMAVPVVPVHRDAEAALANAFLIRAWWRADDVAYGMNGVSWSLSCEAFFYAVFPLAVLVVRRLPGGLSWSLVALGLGLAVIAYLARPGLADHLPLVRVSEFLLGLLAGIAVRDGWRPRVPGVAAAAALTVGLAAASVLPPVVSNAVVAVPFLLVVLHMTGRDLDGRSGWLPSRVLVFAGEASFAFYLVHELVIVNLAPVLPDARAVQVAVISAAAVVAAVMLHLVVERLCNRLLRDRSPSLALATPTHETR